MGLRRRAVLEGLVAVPGRKQAPAPVLVKIAHDHPQTMHGGLAVPDPRVLFRAFGESSLDFELRFFIPQIDERLIVISDINFAVDAAFREEGIEIPFPQRDLHFKRSSQDRRESTEADDA